MYISKVKINNQGIQDHGISIPADEIHVAVEKFARNIENIVSNSQYCNYIGIERPWGIKTFNNERFISLRLVSSVETETDDPFGESDANLTELFFHPHSLVHCRTGVVIGSSTEGAPKFDEGVRCNVMEPESFKNALSENGTLRIFGGTVSELILASGVNVNSCDAFGLTSLMHCAACGHADLCKWLLNSTNADPNLCTSTGATALLLAVDKGSEVHEAIAEILVNHGAHINHSNKWGKSALHIAAFRGNFSMCKLLIRLGGDPHQKDNCGKTCVDFCHETTCFKGSDSSVNYVPELKEYLMSL